MCKKTIMLFVVIIALIFVVGTFSSTVNAADTATSKYPVMSKFLGDIITIIKENKDKPKVAKKAVKALVKKYKSQKATLEAEGKELQRILESKLKDIKGDAKDKMKIMEKFMDIMVEELPEMKEFITMAMDPQYAKVMKAVNEKIKKAVKIDPMKKNEDEE